MAPADFLCFRLVTEIQPIVEDYYSLREIFPDKKFNTCECRARSLSVFSEKSDCEIINKLPAHRNKHMVALRLSPDCGLIKQTGNKKTHFSWWVQECFLNHLVFEGV
ncbi:MAG: hypothetical protein COA78_02105 [Blastopirellula sp.]|nr:MAG: hypothetical protein COA78_02105 [Blastopirellula sp.]